MRSIIINAVLSHSGLCSPVLLEHLLRGSVIGRMAEKGLRESPFFGALARPGNRLPTGWEVADAIGDLRREGVLATAPGFYPGLVLEASHPEARHHLDAAARLAAIPERGTVCEIGDCSAPTPDGSGVCAACAPGFAEAVASVEGWERAEAYDRAWEADHGDPAPVMVPVPRPTDDWERVALPFYGVGMGAVRV